MTNARSIFTAAIFAVLGGMLTGCASAPTSLSGSEGDQTAQETPTAIAEPTPDYASMRLSVAAVGDLMLGTDFPENHLPDDDGENFLQHVTPVLSRADIAFGNLEGVLQDGGEPAKECKNPKACYLFRSPTRYARHLRNAGFDVMSLANNHARDFGEAGRDSSMAALDNVGIYHSGRVGDIALWQQGELRVAMIAFSPTVDSWQLLEPDAAAITVSELATVADIVIVSFHGGAEGFDGAERIGFGMEYAYGEQRGNVVEFAHAVIDSGADLVLGHGPHVPRAMELYKDRLIAYSLGNFATYYGIGVSGPRGYAPILEVNINGYGQFLQGHLYSNVQVRPGGPQPDPEQKSLQMIRKLSHLDFPQSPLLFGTDGVITVNGQEMAKQEAVGE